MAGHRECPLRRHCRRCYGFQQPGDQGHVRFPLPSSQSRRQRDDGESSIRMSDLLQTPLQPSPSAGFLEFRQRIQRLPLLRKDVASNGPTWLPLVLVLMAIAAVSYADHRVLTLSLVYLYILPLTVGAIFLRKGTTYSLIAACILFHYFFHYFDAPRHIHLGVRIFHDLSALFCLTVVVYVLQRYVERQKLLIKTVQQQRDDLLKDVELAAQVQRLFLPTGKPAR